MAYRITAYSSVRDDLKRIPPPFRAKVEDAIFALADDPRPSGVRKLVEFHETYRIRVGIYRIGYQIRDRELLITVVGAGERKEIYSLLKRRVKR